MKKNKWFKVYKKNQGIDCVTERNDFVIETNQGKVNVIFVKKTIDLLRLQINLSM